MDEKFNVYGTVESPIFKASEIAKFMGYTKEQIQFAVSKLEDYHKRKITFYYAHSSCRNWFVTESGVYKLAELKNDSLSKKFAKRVNEVVKDIRQINPLKIKILSENQNKNDENEGTMDALRFLEEYNRMKLNDPKAYDYIKNIADNESLVEYVIKWSKDNPPKTRLQEFLEKYPNAILKNGVPERLCPYDLGYKVEECFGSNNCLKCWNKPV